MSAERRHGRRFEHVELEICWAAIDTLDVALKSVLLRELATDLATARVRQGGWNIEQRVRAAIVSLRETADLLGHSPTLYEYRELRASFPQLNLVADGSIRRAFGNVTWNVCLRRALLDAVSEGDFVTRLQTEAFTLEELISALREYVADHAGAVPLQSEFLAWTRDPAVQARPGRRPLSPGPFRQFGYREVLRLAGFPTEVRTDGLGRVIAVTSSYTDEELVSAVRGVADELERPPREADYRDAHRAALQRVADGQAGPVPPSPSTLHSRWGPWPNVLLAAGLQAPEVTGARKPLKRRPPRYSDAELREWLAKAWTAVGVPFTRAAYRRWRVDELGRLSDTGASVPNVEVFFNRFGSWQTAIEEALPPEADVRAHR